jgi:CHAD domain-containing protein
MVQNTGNKLSQSILRQVEKVEYFCNAENISHNQAVHEFRKSFKRLRALLRFYKRIPGNDIAPLYAHIIDLGKKLSLVRESYLNAELLENELRSEGLIPERKMKQAGEKLHRKNKELIDNFFVDHKICKSIHDFFAGFEWKLIDAGSKKLARIHVVEEVEENYQDAFLRYQNLFQGEITATELHSLRKKLKRLYYQLDFVRLLHPRYFKVKSEQLNIITDQLGDDHDLHVFSEEMHSEEYAFSQEELRIIENQLEHLRELNQLKLFPRLKQFFSEPPEAFNEKTTRTFKID